MKQDTRDAILLVGPLLILVVVLVGFPAVSNIWYAFTKWNGFRNAEFVGPANFIRLLQDQRFGYAIRNTLTMMLYIPLGVIVPLFLAEALREGIPGWKSFRALIYLPTILGYPILGMLLRQLFVNHGAINQWLERVGLHGLATDWIGTSSTAIHTLSFLFVVWVRIGFGAVYLLAAMATIEKDLYDAAKIDGAGWWGRFRNVTVPSIRTALEFWVVLLSIEVFARTFSFVFSFTSGGPGFATHTLEYGIYVYGFRFFQSGYASAWGVVLFVLSLAVALVQARMLKKRMAL